MRLKSPFLFLVLSFLIFLGFAMNSEASERITGPDSETWEVGVYLDSDETTYTLSSDLSINSDTYTVAGIYVDKDTDTPPTPFESLTIGASLNATFNNTSEDGRAYGIYFNVEDYQMARPLNNLTITSGGDISVTATGGYAEAYGVYAYSIDESFVNNEGGSITVTADAADGDAYAYGVYAENQVDNFENSGNIKAESIATATDGEAYAYAYGVYAENQVGNFENSGNITVTATGGYAEAYGVYAYSIDESFVNNESGSITVTADAADGDAYAYGVYASSIGNFTNNGTIKVSAVGNYLYDEYDYYYYYPGVAGVFVHGDSIEEFVNTGKIEVSGNATSGDAYVDGVFVESGITSFSNESGGTISVRAISNSWASAYGVETWDNIGNFTNSGDITVSATGQYVYNFNEDYPGVAGVFVYGGSIEEFVNTGKIEVSGNATSGNAYVDGVFVENGIGNFRNSGNITASANTTGGNAEAYGVSAGSINDSFVNTEGGSITVTANATDGEAYAYGVWAWNNIGNFTNSGDITVNARGGNAEAYGVYAYSIGNFNNTGHIEVNVNSNYQSATINAAVLKISDSSNANIVNNGTMKVVLNLPSNADTTNVNAAVFWIENSNATISNYGNTWVESNVAGSNLRTLYITNSSQVTLSDKFAITFGAPGVNPDTRPIYVGSNSTLDLNNATLIARMDSRNLKLNVPYYLIQKEESGNVTGQWGGLERGYSNPSILVNWYNATSLGADSAVIFTYQATPQQDLAPIVGSVVANDIGTTSVVGAMLMDASPFFNFFVKGERPVMLASSAFSDAGYASLGGSMAGQKGIFWLMPLYTRIEAKDLGFKGNSYGLAMGLGLKLTQGAGLEVFGGYLKNDLNYTVRVADNLDQDNWFGGFNFIYNPKPYIFRLSGLAYKANNDYSGKTGLNYDLKETASFDSNGYRVEAMGGYVFGQKVKLVPQIGLSYSYHKTDSFWTKVPDNPSLSRKLNADDLDVWKVKGLLSVVGETEAGTGLVRYYLGAKVEQAISDNDVEALVTVADTTTKVKRSIGDTTYGVNVGLNYIYNKRWNFEVSGSADFNSDYSSYTGKAILRYSF